MAEEKENDNDSEKTEDPTQHRLDEAFKRGHVPFSREIIHWFMLATAGMLILSIGSFMSQKFIRSFSVYLGNVDQFSLNPSTVGLLINQVFFDFIMILGPFVGFLIVTAILAALFQTRLAISFKAIMPQLNRISPWSGLKRLFSKKSLVEFLKGLFKLAIVSSALFWFFSSRLEDIPGMVRITPQALLGTISYYIVSAIFIVVGCMFFIAVLDYLYQNYEYFKSLKMTKDEVKREFKQQDGDPQIKSRRRQLAQSRIRKNIREGMMKATAVITNPTHYAVAIAYEESVHDAPIVVAKGTDFVALRIRELADELKVPIVENPPLARALYGQVEVDQEIPAEHYRAVAEIIRFVMTLKKKFF